MPTPARLAPFRNPWTAPARGAAIPHAQVSRYIGGIPVCDLHDTLGSSRADGPHPALTGCSVTRLQGRRHRLIWGEVILLGTVDGGIKPWTLLWLPPLEVRDGRSLKLGNPRHGQPELLGDGLG